MVFMIIIPIKWLFHWEYTLFSDKPIFHQQDFRVQQTKIYGLSDMISLHRLNAFSINVSSFFRAAEMEPPEFSISDLRPALCHVQSYVSWLRMGETSQ